MRPALSAVGVTFGRLKLCRSRFEKSFGSLKRRAGGSCAPPATTVFFEVPMGITVVSDRLGDDVRPGTYKAILRQTGIEEDKT